MAINTALNNIATLSVTSELLLADAASRELAPQMVYLDFDGAQTSYRNRDLDLTIENVAIEDSGFGVATISAIVADLNEQFADANVVFTAEVPSTDSYSTIYIGVTSAFEGFGEFYGLAETVDSGNQIVDDNAFVFLNSQASAALVTSVIAHEAGHLLGTLDHGGEGLAAYAAGKDSSSVPTSAIRVNSGATRVISTAEYAPYVEPGKSREVEYLLHVYGQLHVASGGSVNNVQVYSNGIARVTSWGTIGTSTYLSGGPSGTQISGVQVYSGGSLYLSRGLAYNIVVERGGIATLIKPRAKIVGIDASGTVNLGVSARVSAVTIGMGGNVILNGDDAAASGVTVNSGGLFQVENGNAVEVLENGGAVSISDGGQVDFLPKTMAWVTVPTGRWTTVHNKTIIERATLSGGTLGVYYAGQVYNATLNAGRMTVYGGGQAGGVFSSGTGTVSGSVTVNKDAHLTISAQGAATVIENGGYIDVLSGANVEFIPNAISSSYAYTIDGSGTLHSSTSALKTVTLSGYRNQLHIIGGYAAIIETTKTNSNDHGNKVAVVSGGSIGTITLKGNDYLGYYDGILEAFAIGESVNITLGGNSGNTNSSTEVDVPDAGGTGGTTNQGGTASSGTTSSGTASSAATAWSSATISSTISALENYWIGDPNYQDHRKEALFIDSGCIVSSAGLQGDTVTFVNGGRLQSATGTKYFNAVIVSASGVAMNLNLNGHYNAVQVVDGGVVNNLEITDTGEFADGEPGSGHLWGQGADGGGLGVYSSGLVTNVKQTGGRVLIGGGEVSSAILNKVNVVSVYGNNGYLASAGVYNFGRMVVAGGMVEETTLNNGSSASLTYGTFASVTLANVKLDMHAAGVLRNVTVSSGAEVVLTRSNLGALGSTVVLAGELKICAGGKMQITEADLENGNGDLDDLSIQARDVALELELGNGYTGGIGLFEQYQELQSISVSNPNRVTGDFTLVSQATKFYTDGSTITVKVDGTSSLTLQAERLEGDKKPTFYTAADGLQYALTLMPTYWHDEPEPEEHADLVLTVEGKGAAPAEQEQKGLNISVKSANRKEVTLTVTLREDDLWTTVAGIYYSVDGNEYTPMENLTWDTENGKVFGDYTATANGTVHFRAEYFDSSRNMVKDYEVTGISGTTPHNPDDPDNPPYNPDDPYDPSNPNAIIHVTADVTAPTNGKVTLTAVFDEGSVVQQYRDLATGEWMDYEGPVEVSTNGTVYFRMKFEDGSWSKPVRYQVGNIDTVAPVVQLLGGDNTTAGLERTTVRAVTENGLDIYYCADYEGEWRKQTGEVEVTLNGTYRFRATDAAGNIGEAEITFANLAENGLPDAPTVTADITEPTNGVVTLTADFGTADAAKQFRIGDEAWQDYTGPVEVAENAKVYFRGQDAEGTWSKPGFYEVSNIDAAAPVIELAGDTENIVREATLTATTEEGVDIYYSLDEATWTKYEGELTVTANGTYHFKATDAVGNTGTASITFDNLDTTGPDAVADLAAHVVENTIGFTWTEPMDDLAGVEQYDIEVADTEDFSHLLAGESGITQTAFSVEGTVSGTIYCRVRAIDAAGNASDWAVESVDFTVVEPPTPVEVAATEPPEIVNGTEADEVFNLAPAGTWGAFHVARWNGDKKDTVRLEGFNRFHNTLDGMGGYDLLQLPDGDNALLYSDVLSPKADGTDGTERFLDIAEIIGAKNGRNVVDLTAADGGYAGDVLLKGGDQNDHLWGGAGDDILVGGKGDDDLRGGQGDDIYLFEENWGKDAILDDGGKLVFDNALQDKLTFSDGADGTQITDGVNSLSLNWMVTAEEVAYADLGELLKLRGDTMKGFLA